MNGYTIEQANELAKGKESKLFRDYVMFFGLAGAKQLQEKECDVELREVIGVFRKRFFEPIKEVGAIKRIKPSLRKDFDEYFTHAWNEWQAGRGREHFEFLKEEQPCV